MFTTIFFNLNIRSRPGRPPKRHPLERENHSPSLNSDTLNANKNSNNNNTQNGFSKSELNNALKKKLSDATSQKLESSKNHQNENAKLNCNEAISIKMDNTLVSSCSSSTSPFSSFTNSSSSSSSSSLSSSDENFVKSQQKHQPNVEIHGIESEHGQKYLGMGLGNLPFSLLNFTEKFPHQSIPFNSDKKNSKYFFFDEFILEL